MGKIIIAALLACSAGAYSGYSVNEYINEPVEVSCSQAYSVGHLIGCVEKTGEVDVFLFVPCGYGAVWATIRREDAKPVTGGCGVSK